MNSPTVIVVVQHSFGLVVAFCGRPKMLAWKKMLNDSIPTFSMFRITQMF